MNRALTDFFRQSTVQFENYTYERANEKGLPMRAGLDCFAGRTS